MVTGLGVGGGTGAVYAAGGDIAPPRRDCVVTTASTPQLVPLWPAPDSAQESAVAGFEPAISVSVAAITLEPPEATLVGAESCKEKLLVMVAVAEACLEGSGTLCAVSVTVAGAGSVCGAGELPFASSAPQRGGQGGAEMLQRIPGFGCPALVIAAWNGCVAPSSTPMALGVSAMAMSLVMGSVAVANLVVSLLLVAVICKGGASGRSPGAV